MDKLPLLIVEDDASLREALQDTLELAGYAVLTAANGLEALHTLTNHPCGLVLSDVQMQPMNGLELLRELRAQWPQLPVVLMTAYGMIEKAVEAMRLGACNYLTKPFEPETLLTEVGRYIHLPTTDHRQELVAHDPVMQQLLTLARRVAASDASVLITGESGVGKEVLARYLHHHSARSKRAYVAINCAAIPEHLLESTLFGHEKGAFTGAAHSHAGKFEQAQGGTLLLDEISEMPLLLQAKLLRVLQEREVERIGSHRSIPLDIRVIATSNRDMQAEVVAGRFREDLYYRLNVFPLAIPPLRERPADILPLAEQQLSALKVSPAAYFAPCAKAQLGTYTWPGNVRELANVVQRAAILSLDGIILAEHLQLPTIKNGQPAKIAAVAAQDVDYPPPSAITDIKALEKHHILETLASVNGVRKLAAAKLGMSERTLRYKLQQYRQQTE